MRICCLSVQTPVHVVLGGMSGHTVMLSQALAAQGHDVTVLTTRHPRGIQCEQSGRLTIHYLQDTRSGTERGGWWRGGAHAFARLHAQEPFDVVWSQSIAGARIARTFLRRDVRPPLVAFIHGTGPEMARSLVNALRLTPRGWRTTPSTTRHLLRCLANVALVDRPLYRHASAIIAVSRTVAASVRRWYRVPEDRVFVVPNGVDGERYRPDAAARARVRARLGYAACHRVLFVAGALTAQKGVDVAIAALGRLARRHPRLRLLVAGDGPHRAALERAAGDVGVGEAVRFLGAVPSAEMPALYAAADIFVFPTVRVEAFGMVIVEAMAAALPVVVSEIGATSELVQHGRTGLLVPPGDPEALAAQIATLLEDPDRARDLGCRGRETALREWALAARATRVAEIFDRMVARH